MKDDFPSKAKLIRRNYATKSIDFDPRNTLFKPEKGTSLSTI
jgi:hypothetical protein